MKESTRLLIIDDDNALLSGLAETIRQEGTYQVITADNGKLGIELAEANLPHLIVCDVTMPPPDGPAVLKSLSQNPTTAAIPFIFLTTRTGEQDKTVGIKREVDEYITKPFSKDELMGRINAILRRKKINGDHERLKNEEEISLLGRKIHDLIQKFSTDQDGLDEAMAQMLSQHDNETEEHAHHVVELSNALARELGMEERLIRQIQMGALLHDVGKVGIPDSILLKNGILTDEERKIINRHPTIGKRILQPLGLPPAVIDMVYHHHERWDGSGYPDRLAGKKIPLPARLFAIVDVWEAVTNDRPYRKAWMREKAIAYITEQTGKQFDPAIVEKFLRVIQNETKK